MSKIKMAGVEQMEVSISDLNTFLCLDERPGYILREQGFVVYWYDNGMHFVKTNTEKEMLNWLFDERDCTEKAIEFFKKLQD